MCKTAKVERPLSLNEKEIEKEFSYWKKCIRDAAITIFFFISVLGGIIYYYSSPISIAWLTEGVAIASSPPKDKLLIPKKTERPSCFPLVEANLEPLPTTIIKENGNGKNKGGFYVALLCFLLSFGCLFMSKLTRKKLLALAYAFIVFMISCCCALF